jgi:Zn-dependent protease
MHWRRVNFPDKVKTMALLKNRFSLPAHRVLDWTQAEVVRLNHGSIEPEHLLLGLIQEKQGLAYLILQALKINLGNLEIELRRSLIEVDRVEVEKPEISDSAKQVLEKSMESAMVLHRPYLGTEHLLIGLLRAISNRAYPILRRAGVTYNDVLSKVRALPPEGYLPQSPGVRAAEEAGVRPGDTLSFAQILRMVSPVFWVLVGLLGFAGMAAYQKWLASGVSVFLFVTVGWVVSLCLHEFGHALVAYWGGDHSVIYKGYLTLNPLRYTHGFFSVILPLIFLAIGGLGLPGGAVYINQAAIPSKRMRSLTAAGGPVMTAAFAVVLSIPFLLGLHEQNWQNHLEFWAGLAFLAFIQIGALFFNLLPLPGLDGFSILRPYLPSHWVSRVGSLGPFTFLIIFYLFIRDTAVSRGFWILVSLVTAILRIDLNMMMLGVGMYRFW